MKRRKLVWSNIAFKLTTTISYWTYKWTLGYTGFFFSGLAGTTETICFSFLYHWRHSGLETLGV
jgi:hypothetical protein